MSDLDMLGRCGGCQGVGVKESYGWGCLVGQNGCLGSTRNLPWGSGGIGGYGREGVRVGRG